MPNLIKYSTGTESQALRSGNLYLGVGNVEMGPTYWIGISPPVSGYTIYLNKASQGPSIYAPNNDNELISITNQIGGTIKNFAYELPSWAVIRSVITEITDGSISPPNAGAKVWQCVVNTSLYVNTLHRVWNSGSGNGIVGDMGLGYYRYYLWVRGKSTNTDAAWINIDIADGKSSGNVTVGKSESWQLVQLWDNTSASYNVNKFFDFAFNNTDGDTFYISSIVIAAFNTNATESLGQLTYYPGYINYLSTIPVSFPLKEDCFVYSNTRADLLIVNKDYGSIVTDGLVLNLDGTFIPSYSQTGTTWYDLSVSANTCTLVNGPSFNSGGWIVFDGVDDKCTVDSKPERSTGIRLGPGTTPWMVNVLIRTTASGSNVINTFPILSNQSGGPVVSNMGLGAGGVMKYAHYNNAWIIETGTTVVNTGKWVFLSWVNKNNSTLDMYVNGVFDKNVSSNISGSNVNAVDSIGYSWAGYLKADISNLTISTRSTLYTSTDVLQNYYQGNIVTNGLIQYLDASNLVSFPLTGTAFTDMSGYGNSATLVNGASYKINTVPCISLDGTDDKITITNKDLSGLTYNIQYDINWTLACWIYVKTYDASPQTYKHIYGNYNGCNYTALKGNAAGIIIYNSTSQGSIYLNFEFGPRNNPSGSQCPGVSFGWTNAQVGPQLWGLQNRWAYFAITSDDGTNYKLYIDGVQAGPTKTVDFKNSQNRIDNQLTSTSQYAWGNAGGNNNAAIEADFAICQIYNRALSASEIQQNFNAQRNRFRV